MMPVDFPQANVRMEVPEPVSDTFYTGYAGFEFENDLNAPCLLTMWQPNKEDLDALNRGEPIRVLQIGGEFNRIRLYTENNT